MANILYAIETHTNYENFYARCPRCGFENTYNRVSDLEDITPIGYKEVRCLNHICKQPFAINGDLVNPVYEMLIFDCHELRKQKRYSYYILNLAQAFEVFFSLYLRVHFHYRPFAKLEREALGSGDLDQLNKVASELYEATKNYAFTHMLSVFLQCVLSGNYSASLIEAQQSIRALGTQRPNLPKDQEIIASSNQQLADVLKRLKYSKINELRNKIVHQRAYRPRLAEVDEALEETRDIIFSLKSFLRIQDDVINWYIQHD